MSKKSHQCFLETPEKRSIVKIRNSEGQDVHGQMLCARKITRSRQCFFDNVQEFEGPSHNRRKHMLPAKLLKQVDLPRTEVPSRMWKSSNRWEL